MPQRLLDFSDLIDGHVEAVAASMLGAECSDKVGEFVRLVFPFLGEGERG